jgi:hypothetical protein
MSEKDEKDQQSSLDLILTMIFKMALPVWERYKGNVPSDELCKLDERGDWPRGVAAAAMTRLSRDNKLREQLRKSCEQDAVEFEARRRCRAHR